VKTALGGLLALTLLASSAPANADLQWKDEWPRFRTSEYVATGVAGAAFITMYIIPRVPPTWGRPILFDGATRDAFRTDSATVRDNWQRWSTWGYYSMIAYPLLIDGLAVPLARGNSTVAAQTSLINLEAFAISGLLFRVTEALFRRARPYVWQCIQEKGNYDACKESGLGGTNSLISGHVALAATGAALMCTHHAHLSLYGSPWDAIACGAGIAVTGAIAVGRLVTDNHYATDIIAGAVVGGLTGWLVPTALHYGFRGEGVGKSPSAMTTTPLPTASTTSIGITWGGVL
jgi:membrane-associated phospholipid phosphatase